MKTNTAFGLHENLTLFSCMLYLLLTFCTMNAAALDQSPRTSAFENSSPFGFHPASIIPPFKYGLSNPYDTAREIGIKWDRAFYFIWTKEQPDPDDPGIRIWNHDRKISDIPQGINALGNLLIGNPRHDRKYDQYALGPRTFLPADIEKYQAFIMSTVERYDGDGKDDMPGLKVPIRHWQVDNEPPHGLSDYAQFLKITYEAVKRADPDALVLIGGVPGMPPAERYIRIFDRFYMPILDSLSKYDSKYFDIFDFHWFGNASGDYLEMEKVFIHIKRELEKRDLMPDQGFWITEMGTYSGDPKPLRILDSHDFPFQTEKEQAVDLVRRNIHALSLGIKKVFMAFGLVEGFKHDMGYFDFTGLIYDGEYPHDQGKGVRKLGFFTYRKMTETLDKCDWKSIVCLKDTCLTKPENGLHVYRLNRDKKYVWIAWNDKKGSTEIRLSVNKNTKSLRITQAVPDFKYGKDVKNYDTAFKKKILNPGKDNPSGPVITVTDIPVYIEEI
jgi:hypothetical protein